MKYYIVGPVSSGKSTLAKRLSKVLDIPYKSLDEVVHIKDKSISLENRKRDVQERDKIFSSIIQQEKWIIEDVGRECFEAGLKKAHTIILLEVPPKTRIYRIIKRWIKQRLGIEKCIYKPDHKMLKSMLQWSKDYDEGKDDLKKRISLYEEKVIVFRGNKDINEFLEQCVIS